VLVLPDTTAELATQRAEELSKAVAQTDVLYQGRLLEPMVMSFGVATFPENGRTLKDLLRACDNALFRAKDEGRDALRSHE
jgi:diguanylate cyclase (GGDEF)-like protein